nr:immunoglobulin heavy chain junction region [Mus musculus]
YCARDESTSFDY